MAKGTDGFAGRLGELKERSGRSYGALARQLHMSTSTLHRYCNGDAVPTDYAPVERFARLCGATSDELVELHRQWILADEARRRGRTGQSGPAARNAPADGRDPAPVRDAASAPGRAADVLPDGNADAEAVRKAAREPAGQDENGDAADDVAREPAGQDAYGGPARSEPRPGARRRRFRVAVAAAAVAALAVPAAFAVDRIGGDAPAPDPRGEARQDAPGKAEAGAPADGSPSASASASGSPSGGRSPGAKAPGASPSAPAGGGSAKRSSGERGGAAPSVGISSYNWDGPCGEYYLLEQKPEQAAPPPVPQDARRWARTFGGVAGGHMRLQLTVTGNTDASVVLTALNVRVVGRKAPLPWQAYSMGDGCGGGVTPQTFDIDLDDARPSVVPKAGQDGDRTVPAKDFPYKVSTSDPQVLNLDVHTEGHDIGWYLELAWSSGDKSGTIRVDDGGTPFRTSALEGRERYSYWPDKHEWVAE